MIVVQHLRTVWLKGQRSAPRSAERNATPEILPLPYLPPIANDGGLVLHRASFGGFHALDAPEQSVEALPLTEEFSCGCVRVYPEPFPGFERVRVRYAYDAACGGAPERSAFPRDVLHLQPDQWGRVVYNGRFSTNQFGGITPGRGGWAYHRTVVNVAWVTELTSEPFSGTEAKEFRDMAQLL